MFIFEAIADALDSKIYEEEIGKGIDDFGGIDRCIVVLTERVTVSMSKDPITVHDTARR